MNELSEQEVKRQKLSGYRRIISDRMTQSQQQIPGVWDVEEVDVTTLNLRNLVPIVAKSVASLGKEYPLFNSHFVDGEILTFSRCDVGIAVDAPQGLVVPVLRDVFNRSIEDLAQDLRELAERARNKKLSRDDVSDGTITVTSPGKQGAQLSGPLINPPQTAIVGFHRVFKAIRPTDDGGFHQRLVGNLTVTYDHRVIDGGMAGRYTVELARRIETYGQESADAAPGI